MPQDFSATRPIQTFEQMSLATHRHGYKVDLNLGYKLTNPFRERLATNFKVLMRRRIETVIPQKSNRKTNIRYDNRPPFASATGSNASSAHLKDQPRDCHSI